MAGEVDLAERVVCYGAPDTKVAMVEHGQAAIESELTNLVAANHLPGRHNHPGILRRQVHVQSRIVA
jgi:hypothetical protein